MINIFFNLTVFDLLMTTILVLSIFDFFDHSK